MDLKKIKIKQLHPDADLPKYESEGAGCFDVRVMIDPEDINTIQHGEGTTFRTGLAFEIPVGKVMLVFSRSGMGFKNDLRLSNCVGVIDSDYRGELFVRVTKDNLTPYTAVHKERMVQCLIVDAPQYEFEFVENLTETDRGTSGLGSTGKV